ncbi:fimbrial assembly protein [Cellulomonas sp. zg-ZUI222]|uniref:Fimbrial assembly protein n=1 Tax=Cellulomonas wangleii TaxID=2816956 RepID=A0ABX8D9A5_9CELL|nr:MULTISPECIES: fimbrial assembly protein [Cellulomonas]MBO0900369.1 fimbrial assembly protein [Cellulomonas sp. zg-ZUI22]MBO0922801.1 fimbrial assembly protein [Cellulomonas wangleii]MBO0926334.1 fimbrial assembly protein [Cellulomonas wangleii]QVI63981.1 fimbrial assembly protein [Cellulomonas wangleii]
MSTLLKRPLPGARDTGRSAVMIPQTYQVNLLPQQYADRYALGRLKRRLALVLVAVLALAGALYGATLTQLSSAQDRAARAEQETTRLLKAQQQYAEVPVVLGELDRARGARELGMSTEILWAPYLGAIGTVMPEGVTLTNLVMDGATPQLAPAPPAHPLASETVSTIRFEARSTLMVDTAAWIDGLNSVPGFHDAWVSLANVEEFNEETVYVYSSSVAVSPLAYASRFSGED